MTKSKASSKSRYLVKKASVKITKKVKASKASKGRVTVKSGIATAKKTIKKTNKKAAAGKFSAAKRDNKSFKIQESFNHILAQLKKHYPDAVCALDHSNPYELLIATILSAQCTDERVNKVTPALFELFPDPKEMSKAPVEKIEELIHSTGFYKNKAKNIKACCTILNEQHNGEVPRDMDILVGLPGVGRKTANVVLGNAYGIASGVVVDTHVTRLSNRFGWVDTVDAVKIEKILNELCPQQDWVMLSHYLIAHGRAICKARSPDCVNCFLSSSCPSAYL